MKNGPSPHSFLSAVQDFRRARRRAALQDVLAHLSGRPADLLSYEEASQKLQPQGTVDRGLQEIPLDAIVGSVGRYTDFNRSFLPRHDSDEERWASVKLKITEQTGLTPIKVYQIGQAYFVYDGNHRVSVARQIGASHIPALVTELQTRVPLSPDDQPSDLILKAEYADFLQQSQLDRLRPQADLGVTVPGQYRVLLEHIAAQRRQLAQERGLALEEIPCSEAAEQWHDQVYLPVVQVIRQRRLLRDFPGRTETDLYVWVSQHQQELEREIGWDIPAQEAAEHLVEETSPAPKHVLTRIGEKILNAITPLELQAGPPPGHWRQEHVTPRHEDRLFNDVMVAVSGEEAGWWALEGALQMARREGARLHGLHVVRYKSWLKNRALQRLRDEFERHCQEAGVPGRLVVEQGSVSRVVSQRARWADLVVLGQSYAPPSRPIARLGSGLSRLLRHCPRPILTVPAPWTQPERALLAYDGSPKAEEALFVATYLAGRWELPLTVLTVQEAGRTTSETAERARRYLEERGLAAEFVQRTGPVAQSILDVATEHHCDLIVMGGYGRRPLLEVVLGSAVDELLRISRRPLLICR